MSLGHFAYDFFITGICYRFFLLFTCLEKETQSHRDGCCISSLSVFFFTLHTLPFSDYFVILGHFEITPSGYILVKKALDAEEKSSFNLTIEARDEGQPRRSNTVSILENMATDIPY